MKVLYNILLFLIVVAFVSSCKKDYTGSQGPEGPQGPEGNFITVNPAIYGKWSVVSGLPENIKYVIIQNDNVVCFLDSLDYGFKSFKKILAFITYNQIKIETFTFNYSVNGDTMIFSGVDNDIILKRNNNVPELTQWVHFVDATDYIYNPIQSGQGNLDIGFDGTHILWACKYYTNKLYKINPVTHAVSTLNLSVNYFYPSVLYASSFLWISNGSRFDKVDPSSGTIISSSSDYGGAYITALAYDNGYMYVSVTDQKFLKWHLLTNLITPLFDHSFSGLEFVNGYLYASEAGFIYKCKVDPNFLVVESYYVDSKYTRNFSGGITHDGTNFWLVGYDPSVDDYLLLKLDL